MVPNKYLLAFGGTVSTGVAGQTGGFGSIDEGFVRVSVLPPPLGLGIGVSYLDLSVSNTDNYQPLTAQAIELNASWHPLKYYFDPYLQVGELRLFNVIGDYRLRGPSPWNTEGRLGVNLAYPHFAIGLQIRSTFKDYGWGMVGIQVEVRL